MGVGVRVIMAMAMLMGGIRLLLLLLCEYGFHFPPTPSMHRSINDKLDTAGQMPCVVCKRLVDIETVRTFHISGSFSFLFTVNDLSTKLMNNGYGFTTKGSNDRASTTLAYHESAYIH